MSVSVTIGRKLASFPMRRTEGRTYKLVKYGYVDAAIFYQNQECMWYIVTALIPRANGLTSLYRRDRKIRLLDRTKQCMEVTVVPLVRQS